MFEALAKKYFRLMSVLGTSGSIDADGQCAIGELGATTHSILALSLTTFSRNYSRQRSHTHESA